MVSEADSLAVRVPRSEWIAADAAAHLAVTQSIFADLVVGGTNPFAGFEPERYGEVNARLLADNPGRDRQGLALAIARGTDDFLAAVDAAPPGENYDSPLGRMDLTTLLSYCTCHLLMHGHGIALALFRKAPRGRRPRVLLRVAAGDAALLETAGHAARSLGRGLARGGPAAP